MSVFWVLSWSSGLISGRGESWPGVWANPDQQCCLVGGYAGLAVLGRGRFLVWRVLCVVVRCVAYTALVSAFLRTVHCRRAWSSISSWGVRLIWWSCSCVRGVSCIAGSGRVCFGVSFLAGSFGSEWLVERGVFVSVRYLTVGSGSSGVDCVPCLLLRVCRVVLPRVSGLLSGFLCEFALISCSDPACPRFRASWPSVGCACVRVAVSRD